MRLAILAGAILALSSTTAHADDAPVAVPASDALSEPGDTSGSMLVEPDEDTIAAASEAGVALEDLLAAAETMHQKPREYLIGVGELLPPRPALFGSVARADCIIEKESHGKDVPNAQGSGADGPGQYFRGTWATHVALYRAATGYLGSLSLHILSDVRRVMSFILTIPGQRSHWTVSGCN